MLNLAAAAEPTNSGVMYIDPIQRGRATTSRPGLPGDASTVTCKQNILSAPGNEHLAYVLVHACGASPSTHAQL